MAITIDVGKIKLSWKGTYSAGTAYEPDDLVYYQDGLTGSTYICVANSTGNTPSTFGTVNTTYWNLLAKGTSTTSAGTSDGQIQYKSGVGFAATNTFVISTSNYNVGIGSTNPTSKLSVGGNASITGNISVGNSITADSLYVTGIGTIKTLNVTQGLKYPSVVEKGQTISGTANGTSNIDLENGFIVRFTSNSSSTWTHNFRWNASTSLDSVMTTGYAISVLVISPQSSSSNYTADINIDGSARTRYWQLAAPTSGGSSGYDLYTWNIVKTGSNSFIAFASRVNFI